MGNSPAEFRKEVDQGTKLWAKVIGDVGIAVQPGSQCSNEPNDALPAGQDQARPGKLNDSLGYQSENRSGG